MSILYCFVIYDYNLNSKNSSTCRPKQTKQKITSINKKQKRKNNEKKKSNNHNNDNK